MFQGTFADQDPCICCGSFLPRPSGSACHADPCPFCGYPRPLGDCSDLTIGPAVQTSSKPLSVASLYSQSNQKEGE